MKYNAFISYRHADPDAYIAGLLHKKLETFKVPRHIQKATGQKKIERIFRDQEELPIDASLSDNIDAALEQSEFLIAICSPRLLESRWCRAEIENFIKIRGRDHILAVLVEGEPEEAFPDLLRFDENGKPVEPLAADVRGLSKKEMKKKLDSELLRVAAALLHCGYDDLKQRHKERKMRRIMTAMAAGMALMVGFAGYYAYTAAQIRENFRDKQINQSKYLADTALQQLEEGDRMTAIQIALEALPGEENDRPYVPKAEYALNSTLYSYEVGGNLLPDRALKHAQPVSDFDISSEGNYAITVDQGETVTVFDTHTGEAIFTKQAPIEDNANIVDVESAGFLGEEAFVIVYEDQVYCYNIDGSLRFTYEGAQGYFRDFKYHDETNQLIVTSNSDVVKLDPKTGKVLLKSTVGDEDWSVNTDMAFNSDGSLFAISMFASMNVQSEPGKVFVMDLNTGSGEMYTTDKNYVETVKFDSENNLIIASDGYGEDGILLGQGTVERIDLNTRQALWKTPYSYEIYVMAGSSMEMYIRDYTDDEGQRHYHAIYSVNNGLESIDILTGEKVCALKKSSSVTGLLVIKEKPLVYTLERSGAFTCQDMESGQEYTDNAVDTGFTIVDAKNGKGTIGVRGYQSPNLVLLRYVEGEGMTELGKCEDDIVSGRYNSDGSIMAVEIGYGEDAFIRVQNTKDHSVLGEYHPGYYIDSWEMDDDGNLYVFSHSIFSFYDLKKDKAKQITGSDESPVFSNTKIDLDAHKALAYGSGLLVIDTDSLEVLIDVEPSETRVSQAAAGGENGNQILVVTKDNEICILDVSNPKDIKETDISSRNIPCFLGVDIKNSLDLSDDGTKAVFNCTDGTAKVYDIEKDEITDEIPFVGRYRAFLRFTDDNVLLMQGDDFYFRAYDLNSHQMKTYANDQYYEIERVEFEGDKVKLISLSNLYILNREDYELTASIEDGCAVSVAASKVIVGRYKMLYEFPYKTLSDLQKIAKEELNGETLSVEKRLQLNMD